MVWQRCVGFEHNQGLGGTEVNLDKINMGQHIGGWYPLFPMHSFGGSDSDNSPWPITLKQKQAAITSTNKATTTNILNTIKATATTAANKKTPIVIKENYKGKTNTIYCTKGIQDLLNFFQKIFKCKHFNSFNDHLSTFGTFEECV